MNPQKSEKTEQTLPPYSVFLANKLESIQERNKSFSLRAYASLLEVSPSHLSLVLRGKRSISKQTAMSFAQKLELNLEESYEFIQCVVLSKISLAELSGYKNNDHIITVDEKNELTSRYISDPDYHNMCVYFGLENRSNDVDVISSSLGINRDKVVQIIKDLFKLKYVEIDENDNIRTKHSTYDSNIKIAPHAIKQLLQAGFEESINAINTTKTEERHLSFTAMSVNKEKLPELKALMTEFRHKIANFSGHTGNSKEVYNLTIGFFPKSGNKDKNE